ncbi:hypothetical protein ABV23_RS02465 [Escherichia coli]|nr:hypothetical protein [Escherichia coli]
MIYALYVLYVLGLVIGWFLAKSYNRNALVYTVFGIIFTPVLELGLLIIMGRRDMSLVIDDNRDKAVHDVPVFEGYTPTLTVDDVYIDGAAEEVKSVQEEVPVKEEPQPKAPTTKTKAKTSKKTKGRKTSTKNTKKTSTTRKSTKTDKEASSSTTSTDDGTSTVLLTAATTAAIISTSSYSDSSSSYDSGSCDSSSSSSGSCD